MKIRNLLTALAVTAVSATALADLSGQYLEWGKGPAQYLMTKEEAAQWKNVKSDQDAKAFIDLFWARRDPTPATPENEYRTEVEARITAADQQFNKEKVRGAMTDRGRTLVIFGLPAKVERVSNTPAQSSAIQDRSELGREESKHITQQWTYENEQTRDIFGTPKAAIRFVDRAGKGEEFVIEPTRVNVKKAQENAVKLAVKQPNLTVAPAFAAAAPLPAVPVVSQTPDTLAATELTTPALAKAVADLKAAEKNPYEGKLFASWGEFVTPDGETFVPVLVFVPKPAAIASSSVTFFGVVQNESGSNVAAFEAPATLTASKDEQFVDRTLRALPAGKYKGYFGLAEGEKVLAIASTDMELAGSLDKDATGTSHLILSNNLYPLTEAQRPTDPFAFGGIKVVPKADRTFRPADELWYFFELRNPGIPAPAADAAAPAADAPPAVPKIQVKIEIEGTTSDAEKKKVKMAAPPREVEAIPMKGVEGHYGIGNAIPLETFKPGDYTFTIKVIDTVKKSSYTMTDKFRVVAQ